MAYPEIGILQKLKTVKRIRMERREMKKLTQYSKRVNSKT
jgi:hypothetical protein